MRAPPVGPVPALWSTKQRVRSRSRARGRFRGAQRCRRDRSEIPGPVTAPFGTRPPLVPDFRSRGHINVRFHQGAPRPHSAPLSRPMHGSMYGCMHSCVCARLCRFTKSARVRSILGMVFWLDLFLRCGAAAHPNSVCDQIFATTISLSCFYYIEHEAMRAFQIQEERSISRGAAVLPAFAPEPRDSSGSDIAPSAT